MNSKPINVTCAIIQSGNSVLAAQRSQGMALPLKWEFPGGKIEHGESEEQCLQREIREELDIEIEIINRFTPHVHDYGHFSIRLIPFLCKYLSGKITAKEHSTTKYFGIEELSNLDWAPADVPILDEFLRYVRDSGQNSAVSN